MKPKRHLGLDEIVDSGFVVLGEEPGRELVLGVVGKFWRPTSAIRRIEAGEFTGFDAPASPKRRGTSSSPSVRAAARRS